MRLSAVFVSAIALLSTVIAAPITEKESDDSSIKVPSEAILGFLDLTADDDVGLVKINNGTHSGILFLNTTIASIAYANETILSKREASAEADPWKWLSLRVGQPIYKREASPEAEAEPWEWLSLRVGQPLYKREASPEAEAEADPWKWLSFRVGQPIYKREASPEAEADPWKWLSFRIGQPIY